MSRTSGTSMKLDLGSQGSASVTGAFAAGPQTISFTLPTPKFDARGNYPRAEGVVVRLGMAITNADGASVPIQVDDLPRAVLSFDGSCPLLGTFWDPQVFTGPITKNVIEYLANGYRTYGPSVEGVPQDTASAVYYVYFYLPFKNECFFSPLDFCPWVGWLTQMQLKITLAASNVFSSLSTNAAIGSFSLNAWLEANPTKTLELPAFSQWRIYTPAAAGGQQALMQDVGQQGGLSCVQPGSRIAAMLEMCSNKGLGGAALSSIYTSFSCDQLSQPVTQNVDSFLTEYMALSEQNARGPRAAIDPNAGLTLVPTAGVSGNPNTVLGIQATTTSGSLLTANAMAALFMPWRVPGKLAEIGSQPKFQGNLTANRTFTVAPSSGSFPFVLNELRQLSEASAMSLLTTAGVSAQRAAGMQKSYYDGMPQNPRSGFAMPVRIPNAQ